MRGEEKKTIESRKWNGWRTQRLNQRYVFFSLLEVTANIVFWRKKWKQTHSFQRRQLMNTKCKRALPNNGNNQRTNDELQWKMHLYQWEIEKLAIRFCWRWWRRRYVWTLVKRFKRVSLVCFKRVFSATWSIPLFYSFWLNGPQLVQFTWKNCIIYGVLMLPTNVMLYYATYVASIHHKNIQIEFVHFQFWIF